MNIRELHEINNQYDLEIEKIKEQIENKEQVIKSLGNVKEVIQAEKQKAEIETELKILLDLKSKNLQKLKGCIYDETTNVVNEYRTACNAYDRESMVKAKDIIVKAHNDLIELQKQTENKKALVDKTDLTFMLDNYLKVMGNGYNFTMNRNVNSREIEEMRKIVNRVTWK